MSTRLAWSTFGSVQSTRTAGATRPCRLHAAGGPPDGAAAAGPVSNPNLDGGDSPQTIAQSAHDGVPISGREPARRRPFAITSVELRGELGRGRHHGDRAGHRAAVPVVGRGGADPGVARRAARRPTTRRRTTGSRPAPRPTAASPPWAPDLSGRVVAQRRDVAVAAGAQHISIPLDAGAARAARRRRLGRWRRSRRPATRCRRSTCRSRKPGLSCTATARRGGRRSGAAAAGCGPRCAARPGSRARRPARCSSEVDGTAVGGPVALDASGARPARHRRAGSRARSSTGDCRLLAATGTTWRGRRASTSPVRSPAPAGPARSGASAHGAVLDRQAARSSAVPSSRSAPAPAAEGQAAASRARTASVTRSGKGTRAR